MSEGVDERLAARLNARAPAERDAMFRIQVLQLREERRFRRRNAALIGMAGAFAVACGLTVALRPDLLEETGAVAFAVVAATAAFIYRPALMRLIGRLPI